MKKLMKNTVVEMRNKKNNDVNEWKNMHDRHPSVISFNYETLETETGQVESYRNNSTISFDIIAFNQSKDRLTESVFISYLCQCFNTLFVGFSKAHFV